MKRALYVGAALSLGLALSTMAAAETVLREGAGMTQTIECRGRSFMVNGSSNTFTLLGECPSVSINGMSNTIKVETVGSIDVDGMSNTVIWESAISGSKPRVQTDGIQNSVRKGTVAGKKKPAVSPAITQPAKAPEAASPRSTRKVGSDPIEITGAHVRRRINCAGRDVSLMGSHCNLTLVGECGRVSVSGSHNKVRLEIAERIEITGSYNRVAWESGPEGRRPKISNLGHKNEVSKSED
jgi:hypothetical protein